MVLHAEILCLNMACGNLLIVCSFTHESSPGRAKFTGDFLIIDWECRNPLERPLTPLFPFWDKWNALNLKQCKKKIRRDNLLNGRTEIRNFSSSVQYIFQQQKRNFISPGGHVMFCYIKNTNKIPNHLTSILFGRLFRDCSNKSIICYITLATVIFSCMKITSYLHV